MKLFLRQNLAALLMIVSVLLGLLLANFSPRHALPLALFNWGIDLDLGLAHAAFGPELLILTFGISGFFFLVGMELKRELIGGSLRPARNLLAPLFAAILGVVLPAAWYLVLNSGTADARGWAIPTATDVTFALAVFVLFGKFLPPAARTFLLAFAVIDDVIAVLIITFAIPTQNAIAPLGYPFGFGPVLAAAIAFTVLVRARLPRGLAPVALVVAVAAWLAAVFFTEAAGIEPALMGLLLALAVKRTSIHQLEARLSKAINYVALPLFGLLAGAVVLPGVEVLGDSVFWGVALRPIWKFLGVFLGGWIGMRFANDRMKLPNSVLAKVAVLGGIGFTVSLLVANLAFSELDQQQAKAAAVLGTFVASAVSAIVGALLLARGHRAKTADRA